MNHFVRKSLIKSITLFFFNDFKDILINIKSLEWENFVLEKFRKSSLFLYKS